MVVISPKNVIKLSVVICLELFENPAVVFGYLRVRVELPVDAIEAFLDHLGLQRLNENLQFSVFWLVSKLLESRSKCREQFEHRLEKNSIWHVIQKTRLSYKYFLENYPAESGFFLSPL